MQTFAIRLTSEQRKARQSVYSEMSTNNDLLNCWKLLKSVLLQRRDEISSSVNVTKVEKIDWMAHG